MPRFVKHSISLLDIAQKARTKLVLVYFWKKRQKVTKTADTYLTCIFSDSRKMNSKKYIVMKRVDKQNDQVRKVTIN